MIKSYSNDFIKHVIASGSSEIFKLKYLSLEFETIKTLSKWIKTLGNCISHISVADIPYPS